jgi:hypothetical protein
MMEYPSSLDRTLRTTTIVTFLLAFALLIPYGVTTAAVLPALGLVPAFISAILSPLALNTSARWRWFILCIDAFVAVFLFGILMPFFFITAGNMRWLSNGAVMLGAYGSVPLMIDL